MTTKVLELTVSTEAFRDRAFRMCVAIEQLLSTLGPELHVAEALLALHLVRRRLERAFARASNITPERREEMLQQVEAHRASYDAFLAAEDLKKGGFDA